MEVGSQSTSCSTIDDRDADEQTIKIVTLIINLIVLIISFVSKNFEHAYKHVRHIFNPT